MHPFRLFFLVLCFGDATAQAQDAFVKEVNLARTNPRAYSRIVAANPGPASPRAVAEAVRFLQRAAPLPTLARSPGLTRAAASHVREQGATGAIGHVGANGMRSFQRMSQQGRWIDAIGENVDYGSAGARATVVRLIIDEGVRDRGHRRNLFSPAFRVVGIASGPHPAYGRVCVMDFAAGFVERAEQLAAR